MLKAAALSTVLAALLAFPFPVPAAVCDNQVQGRVAWNDQGNTRWNPANVQRLCRGAEDSAEPARCFQQVMHGGIDTGAGPRIGWGEVLDLCAGTRDHRATVNCFTSGIGSGRSRAAAIEACKGGGSGTAGAATVIVPDLPVQMSVPTIQRAPTIEHTINVVEHLCINTTCESGDGGWDKTRSEMDYDGTSETTFVVDVDSSSLVRLCPVRRRTTDREFGGNGPAVRAYSGIEQQGRILKLTAFMEASETGGGTSFAAKTWRGDLYRAPAGWRITGFSPRRSETAYTDRDHEEDAPPVHGDNLVASFRFKGDTGGDDIGNCTGDDTYMTIAYNPVRVSLAAERGGLRELRINRGLWVGGLTNAIRRLRIGINNYDRTKRQPENGVPEKKYFIDRTDRSTWASLSPEQVRQASHFEYRGADTASSVPPTPLPVPAIRRNTFTFLMNDIFSNGRSNGVDPAGDHIRFTIVFESQDPEIVAACVDNAACGTGEPHEAGKPLVQVDNLRIFPYLRPRVERSGETVIIRADLSRIRVEADIRRDGTCRDNLFAFACGAFAGNIERIAYEAILDQLNRFVAGSAALTGLLDRQLTSGICAIVGGMGENCGDIDNIVLDGNGDLLLWMRS